MRMIYVGVREAKINLSKLLKRVMQGQEIGVPPGGPERMSHEKNQIVINWDASRTSS